MPLLSFPEMEKIVLLIRSVFAEDRELGLLACDRDLLAFGEDHYIIIRKFPDNAGEYLSIDSNDTSGNDQTGNLGLNPQFHIIGNESDVASGSIDRIQE